MGDLRKGWWVGEGGGGMLCRGLKRGEREVLEG